ncbi:E3 ubiquitin-protein ligase FANCL [Lutzomyia longipalpis]|uniref:E3 ubiquitin-protein ligase FANCL n=1 Tax=Lutzomyia longipalpis TaxID=7200 RepID=UPI00248398A3|nr:E3 ubiquitin-protein ligase FANCL [Lutzomyia longipalpis]
MKNFLEIDAEKHKFVGFLTIKEDFFKINVTLPEYPLANGAKVEVYDLCEKIPVDLPPECGETAEVWMGRLEMYLELNECKESSEIDGILSSIERYEEILRQLDVLENSGHTVEATNDFSRIKVGLMSGNEQHFVEFGIVAGGQVKVLTHSLPSLPGEMFWKIGSIESHMSRFRILLGQIGEFYTNLHTIDELCFVVGPGKITTKTTYRIIKFNEKIFLKIKLDPLVPSQISLAFIGPIAKVEPLRGIYNEKIADWDNEMDVHKNLLRMYDLIYFPMRGDEEETPCSICFEYAQGKTIPIISCDNTKCNVIFHLQCLREYFDTLRGSKTMFTLAMGQCPFCRQKLTTFLDFVDEAE